MKKMYVILGLAIISFINAYDLTKSALELRANKTTDFYCDINSLFSCSSVFQKDFARLFGIPFSQIAMVVYPMIALIALFALIRKWTAAYQILFYMSLVGVVFNGYIIINEFFEGVFCPSCLACTFAIVTIGALSFFGMGGKRSEEKKSLSL